ncbi:MAG: CubicO group peptidase (beta-lactamase class C family) [Verrucomicrobiales bacterium]|jgi:CubicO group peptidase (beta-lactamase class C family)
MNRYFLLPLLQLLCVFLVCVSCGSNSLAKEIAADPRVARIDPASIAKVRSHVQALVDAETVAGAVLVVARNGKLAMLEPFGKRNLKTGDAMAADAIFRIYSMSKPVTSVAIMMLVESGDVELDTAVEKYLPDLKGLKLQDGSAPQRAMTVRDLLRHSSGLTYGFMGDSVRCYSMKGNSMESDCFRDQQYSRW